MALDMMKAYVMNKVGDAEVKDRAIPKAGPNSAIVKTTLALVCTSDVHTIHGGLGEIVDRCLGHEAVGIIHELGANVQGFKVGQRVAVNAVTPCFQCENCQNGVTSQCGGMLGGYKFTFQKDGNMAEYFEVNDAKANLAPIPDDVSDEAAAYTTDMMSTGFMGAENAHIPLGGSCAVFGCGPVGLMAVAGARMLGAGLLIAVDGDDRRLKLAQEEYGADIGINFTKTDPISKIMELTNGRGVDSAIEAVGSQATFEGCIKATCPGGTISNIGYHGSGDNVKIPLAEWGVGMSNKTIMSGLCEGGSARMGRLMTLLRNGRVDPTKMSTHHFDFKDVDKALKLMDSKEDGIIKPVIHFPV
ncbi:NAD(P)-dependent alcohol dehydrogenase [Paracoccus jiaweipingae]|uniref:NAD(P)-dependent alcohol dehydrogenase n=1 Tax=unclassified Paracoccus (in: a-proteobacteria) TaxID=2688777 RepID=UPI00378A64D8